MKRQLLGILLVGCALLWGGGVLFPAAETGRAADQRVEGADIWFAGADFAAGQVERMVANEQGLRVPAGVQHARFTAPEQRAPLPFSALVPRWQADLPAGMALTVLVRTRPENGEWTEWIPLHENHDLTLPEDTLVTGEMLAVPAADGRHTVFQYRLEISGTEIAAVGWVRQMGFTFIDATAGPSHDEILAQYATMTGSAATEGGDYPKPPVIGREVWCLDPRCDEPGELFYEPVTHLMVHHTVSQNSSSDWAAVVRAIWYFHAITREWDDIGYNYLVDMDGVLYEGRAGGDDVIGIHAAAANAGSMALAFIGNFVGGDGGIDPPAAMLNSAAELFAWKADHKEIDVFDSSMLPNMDWGLPHFSGHRDVYGTTVCPGDRAHALLPALRDEVAARINFTPPHIYYDELDPDTNFELGPGFWLEGPLGCGFNVHAYYLETTQDPGGEVQVATWQPEVAFPGRYELEVFAPYCNTGMADTEGAVYQIEHAEGTEIVTINQEANLGLWMSLGTYRFAAGNGNRLTLSNLTQTDSDIGIWFDALRLRYEGPSASNVTPPNGGWLSSPTVTYGWSLSDPAGVLAQILQVATEETFTSLAHQSPLLPAGTVTYTHTLSEDAPALFWRVAFTDTFGNPGVSSPTWFGLDTAAPASTVTKIYELPGNHYQVQWQGSDALSGVATYAVAYRAADDEEWTTWLTNTTDTAGWFTPPMTETVYWFASQAVDVAGNVEPLPAGDGDLSTDQAIFLPDAIMVPAIMKP